MELWLLGAGAIVLIGITLWIVWPARAADAVETLPLRNKEVVERSMTDTPRPGSGLPPQGDKFEDQYTSATADLSAGGVAEAIESMHEDSAADETPTSVPAEVPMSVTPPPSAPTFNSPPAWTPPPFDERGGGPEPRKIGLGAAIVLAVIGGLGGAWLYARWQRERNKPINRLRRGARDFGSGAREFGSRLGERIPEVDDLPPAAAPMSGAAAALLLAGLLASRLVRRHDDDPAEQVRDAVETAQDRGRKVASQAREVAEDRGREAMQRGRDVLVSGLLREALERGLEAALKAGKDARAGREALEDSGKEATKRGREAVKRGREAAQKGREAAQKGREAATHSARDAVKQGRDAAESSEPSKIGIGLGSSAAIAAGAYLIWRLTHREPPAPPKPWYAGVQS